MPSAAEDCRELSGNCQRILHCLESGHPGIYTSENNWPFLLNILC